MWSTMASSSSWRPETLTEMSRVSPRACQAAICSQASRSTQRPTSRIWPVCSRIGMNSSGWMSPSVGMLPAQQRLDADEGEVVEVVDRLVDEAELLALERRAEVELEVDAVG